MIKLHNIFSRRNRILLAELVRTDFRLRYENSALGYVWSILNPLLLFAVLYVVFALVLGVGSDIPNFPVYLLIGVVLWRFFTETTNNGLKAIVARGSLIRKINFPKYIIVISGTVSSLINLGINLIVVAIFMAFNGIVPGPEALLIIPLIFELYAFALGIAFFLSALNVYLRDIGYLWEVVIQAAFYATPILYPLQRVLEQSELVAQIQVMIPVAQVIQDVRHVLITDQSITSSQLLDGWMVFIPYVTVIIVGVIGGLYFKRKSGGFAEYV